MNLIKKGSWNIYPKEYKWTKKEIKVIIISMILVKLSYKNPILIIIFWIFMKSIKLSETIVWFKPISWNINNEMVKDARIQIVHINMQPFFPRYLPKPSDNITLRNGSRMIRIYN